MSEYSTITKSLAEGNVRDDLRQKSSLEHGTRTDLPLFYRYVILDVVSDPTIIDKTKLDYWENDHHIFVHASVAPELELSEQPDYLLFWQAFADPTIHRSGKQMICGHKSQKSGLPAVFDNGICIDTLAYGGGWLSSLDIGNRSITQVNELGEHRVISLPTRPN